MPVCLTSSTAVQQSHRRVALSEPNVNQYASTPGDLRIKPFGFVFQVVAALVRTLAADLASISGTLVPRRDMPKQQEKSLPAPHRRGRERTVQPLSKSAKSVAHQDATCTLLLSTLSCIHCGNDAFRAHQAMSSLLACPVVGTMTPTRTHCAVFCYNANSAVAPSGAKD